MTRIYMPSSGPEAWRPFLAEPDRHWVTGYSARTLAHCWEGAVGVPPEIQRLLDPLLGPVQLLLAIPEHKVPLEGGGAASQCDVFALLRAPTQVIAAAIEGKVDEPFDKTLGEWLKDASPGKRRRLEQISRLLGLPEQIDRGIRYQLLHRTASAVIEAERFLAGGAAMIVHSFSPDNRWFDDFERFVALLGGSAEPGRATQVTLPDGRPLILGWASGEQHFRTI